VHAAHGAGQAMVGRVELGHTRTCGSGPAWARKDKKLVGAMLGATGRRADHPSRAQLKPYEISAHACKRSPQSTQVLRQRRIPRGVVHVVPWTHFWYVHVSLSLLLSYYYYVSFFYGFLFLFLFLYFF